jgi:hypothetical protein
MKLSRVSPVADSSVHVDKGTEEDNNTLRWTENILELLPLRSHLFSSFGHLYDNLINNYTCF